MIANRIVCFCNIRDVSTGHIVREDGETFAFFGKPSHTKRTRLKPTTAAIAATVPCNAMQTNKKYKISSKK